MGTKPVERRQTAPHRQLKTMASKAEKEATKVSKWDAAAVKNALDDAVKEVMKNKLAFPECHKLMDGRLLICSVAVAAAMFALLWDFLNPLPKSKPVLIICASTYFLLMGVLTLYTTYKEKGIFFKNGKVRRHLQLVHEFHGRQDEPVEGHGGG